MIKQLSEKKVLGAICIVLMILCSDVLYAEEEVTGTNEMSITDVQSGEQNFDFDKEAIHRLLQEKLSNELLLVNKGTEQAIARNLPQHKEKLYYVLLLPEKSFAVGPSINDEVINVDQEGQSFDS